MTEQVAEEVFHTASESIEVPPPPYDAVVRGAHEHQRRRRRTVVAAVAAGAVVVAGLTWAGTRSEPEQVPLSADVTRSPNPVDLVWYGGGRLHLDAVAIDLPQVTDLAELDGGAVYSGVDGMVVFAAPDGTLTPLGRKETGSPIAVSDENSWVSWVDWGDDPELVVHDVAAGLDIGRMAAPPGATPVAIDQDRLYYLSEGRTFSWAPLTGENLDLGRRALLDVASATRVYDENGWIEMVQPFFSVSFRRPGSAAELSPGGNVVLARPAVQPSGPFRPVLYDARSGDRLRSGVDPDELVTDAAFGPNHTISYLVARAGEFGTGPDPDGNDRPLVVLRTCDLVNAECHDIVPLARPGEWPLLAH